MIVPINPATPGSAIPPMDWNNQVTSSDASMSYTCQFDRFVDNSTASGTVCGSLPGMASFSGTTGILNWTPGSTAWGPYEICVTGTNTAGTNTSCALIEIPLPVSSTQLLLGFDSMFADTSGGQGKNGTGWSARDVAGGSPLTLLNFAQTNASGFEGYLPDLQLWENMNPYRLVFDGVDDQLDLGTSFNSQSGFVFDTWLNPSSVATTGTTILSNGDSAQKGFKLSQSRLGDQSLQLTIGQDSYVDEVMSDLPIAYYRMNESSGPTVSNLANPSVSGSSYNVVGFGNAATPVRDNRGKSISLNPTGLTGQYGGINLGQGIVKTLFDPGNSFTVELWVNPASSSGAWRWIFSKAFSSHVPPYYQFDIRQINGNGVNATLWQSSTYSAYIGINSPAANSLVIGSWNHVVVTFDHATTTLRLYLNGQLSVSSNVTNGAYGSHNTDVNIGENLNLQNNSTYSFRGGIAEVALYPSALPLARVQAHYAAASRPTCYSSTALADLSWYHVGGQFINASELSLYVSGALECVINQAATYSGSSNPLVMGSLGSSAWSGTISEFRLYSPTALSTTIPFNFTATNLKY